MDKKKLIPVIAVISLAVMVLWGFLVPDGWSKSWLAAFVGGCAIVAVGMLLNTRDGEK